MEIIYQECPLQLSVLEFNLLGLHWLLISHLNQPALVYWLEFILIIQMGANQLGKKDNIPNYIAFTECRQMLIDTRQLLEQNKQELQFHLSLFISSFQYHQQQWRVSKVTAEIIVISSREADPIPPSEVTLQMQQIYKIHQLIKHFRKTEMNQPEEENTLGGVDQMEEEKDCCICFNNKASTMLPCGHCYCPLCTSKYIIQQQQHRCPQCRRQFHGNKKKLQSKFYQVIEEDTILYVPLRNQILECIAKHNLNEVRTLKQTMGNFQSQ